MTKMSGNLLLKMDHITKRFPGVVALNDVSIELYEGEILSLIGENGAGKSTLMKILSGDYPHGTYEGTITLNGKPLNITSPRYAEKEGIAMIYQHIHVELDLTVTENIMLGILPKNNLGLISWKKARQMAVDVLKRLKVDLDPDTIMRSLNTSMQQLVCIARALVRNPKVLILDEPTAALTESETQNLLAILEELKQTGIGCIYISHKLKEVFLISDRACVMRDAQNISCYLKQEIKSEQIIEDMIGRHMEALYPSMEGRLAGEEVLRVENYAVQHPSSTNKNIIEDVSFSLKKGEVLGLVGLVGSGRSELLRAIFGAMPKRSGKTFINGKPCEIHSTKEAIANHIGFLTEDRKKDGVVGTMDIRENMTLSILKKVSKASFISQKAENEKVQQYFNMLKIKAPSAKTMVVNLSGGNQQKVVLAKSLLTDMQILFLDEPTAGIDVGAKAEIYKIIKDLAESGVSIIMVSSEYPELLAMCDRFVVIANGKVAGEVLRTEASEMKMIRMASNI